MDRAFSDLTIRSVDEEKRQIRGWATRPFLDRVSDRIAPLGCTFRNPCVLLLQHQHDRPVGTVVFDKPTKEGVGFTARIPKIAEPGILKDRTDEAFQSCKAKILRHVSIGFRPTKPPVPNEEGGLDWDGIEIMELSLVSVAALPQAEILEVRGKRAGKPCRVVRLSTGPTNSKPSTVVKLDPVAHHRIAGTLKIHTAPRNKPGEFKVRKIHRTGTRIVRLTEADREAGRITYERQLERERDKANLSDADWFRKYGCVRVAKSKSTRVVKL